MGQVAEASVAKLRAEREETLRALLTLAEADCRAPAPWGGTTRTVNFLLRAFSLHQLDHLQHLQKLLRDRGHSLTEPQILLMKAQALMGELETLFLSLSDEQFTETGPNEGDWSADQIVQHIAKTERQYREDILTAIEKSRAAAAGA